MIGAAMAGPIGVSVAGALGADLGAGEPGGPGSQALSTVLGGKWGGFLGSLTGHSQEAVAFAHALSETPYGSGAQTGHAIGMLASTVAMITSMGLSEAVMGGKGVVGHATSLGAFASTSLGTAAPSGDTGVGGPSTTGGGRYSTEPKIEPVMTRGPGGRIERPAAQPTANEPVTAPVAGPSYTETKEYLGAQQNIRLLQTEISRLGGEIAEIRQKRENLKKDPRRMVGRIPLVHTELGSPEPKALTPEGRQRMLMSHSVPVGERRRAGA